MSVSVLDITNHVRRCSLFELRTKLEELERLEDQTLFVIVSQFLMSLRPDPKFDKQERKQ